MRRSRRSRALGSSLIWPLLAAFSVCEESGHEPAREAADNELGVLLDALGVEIPSCVDAGSALVGTTLTKPGLGFGRHENKFNRRRGISRERPKICVS